MLGEKRRTDYGEENKYRVVKVSKVRALILMLCIGKVTTLNVGIER